MAAFRIQFRYGITLVEVAICTVILGIGFVAAMELFVASTRQNADNIRIATAASLAGNIREIISQKAFIDPIHSFSQFGRGSDETGITLYDDIDDFDGLVFNPPVDVVDPLNPQIIANIGNFTQQVSVVPIRGDNFTVSLPKTSVNYTAVRVAVDVLFRENANSPSRWLYTLTWIEFAR